MIRRRELSGAGRLSTIVGLVVVPALFALAAAEAYLALRERRPAHWLAGHVVSFFPTENEQNVKSLRRLQIAAYPFVAPQQYLFRPYGVGTSGGLFPLAGISGVTTELCNESGLDVVYRADAHGFNNPAAVWAGASSDVALIGDSFVHGICVPSEYQLASLIRQTFPATANLGVLGSGPLSELGLLREYAARLRPRTVIWAFYEGNDLEDLERETDSPMIEYLDPSHSQDLLSRQAAIDSALANFADSVLNSDRVMTPGMRDLPGMLGLPRVRKAMGMLAANAPNRIDPRETQVLDSVFALAKAEVSSWGGALYVAYLPDYHRFDGRVLSYSGYVHNNADIQRTAFAAAARAGIPVIDVAAAFALDANPRRYWPRPTSHYGVNGYALAARTILAAIEVRPAAHR